VSTVRHLSIRPHRSVRSVPRPGPTVSASLPGHLREHAGPSGPEDLQDHQHPDGKRRHRGSIEVEQQRDHVLRDTIAAIGETGDIVADFDVSLDGDQVYTGFAADYLSPDDEPGDTPFDLLLSQDTSGV
jgi:hypothetical protein